MNCYYFVKNKLLKIKISYNYFCENVSILSNLNNVLPSFIRLRVAPSPKHIRRVGINAYNPIVRLSGYLN